MGLKAFLAGECKQNKETFLFYIIFNYEQFVLTGIMPFPVSDI